MVRKQGGLSTSGQLTSENLQVNWMTEQARGCSSLRELCSRPLQARPSRYHRSKNEMR